MIVRNLKDMADRTVRAETWESRRLLLRADGMGFSMHDTILYKGTRTEMHYKNHLEAVYCIEGHAKLTDLATGEVYELTPGSLYALNEHDHHVLEVIEDFRCVCVFNPALVGPETHGEDGAYPLL
ncbi:MAG: ectoine synthase [Sandaracinaceae bacterium]|nr:ectoine synthase [Sandaracinaceae bacterium]